jgi:cytochrome P450
MDILRVGIEDRVRAEFEPCFTPGSLDVDVQKLCSRPLLQSIYMETLRLRSSAGSARQPIEDGFRIDSWSFKKDGTLFTVPWLSHRDTTFWNTGHEDDNPSVDDFWAERFLEYPGEPCSGPIRKNDKPEIYSARDKKPTPKSAEDDKKAKLVTSGIQGHYLPYGGGMKMCPGRFFATQEMMAAIAVLLQACDMELLDPAGAGKIQNSMSRFPFGTLVPDAKIPVRIRKRAIK